MKGNPSSFPCRCCTTSGTARSPPSWRFHLTNICAWCPKEMLQVGFVPAQPCPKGALSHKHWTLTSFLLSVAVPWSSVAFALEGDPTLGKCPHQFGPQICPSLLKRCPENNLSEVPSHSFFYAVATENTATDGSWTLQVHRLSNAVKIWNDPLQLTFQ